MHFDKEQQRKEFEEKFANPRKLSISRYDNIYADEFTQLPWEAWQAAIEQASQRIAQLETYISDNLHKKAVCGCGDSIEPDTGAVCGTCASIEQASQPQWIPVSERQPNDKQQVLGFDNGSIKTLTCDHFKCGKVEFWQDHAGYVFNVTYWMPLPAAPKSAI